MLKVNGITCGYGKKTIIEDISFELENGKVCGLIGVNGAGKSTLIKCIMGYLKPKSGEILLGDTCLLGLSEQEVAKRIAYVAQNHDVPFSFSVLEMVLMGRTPYLGGFYGPKRSDYEMCINELQGLGMADYINEPFQNLSGGQKQLCYLARAFAQDTDVIVLDEPTSNLDYKNQMLFWKIIRERAAQGKTIFVCVHDPNHVLWFCDNVVALASGGHLLAHGKTSEVFDEALLKEVYGIDIINQWGQIYQKGQTPLENLEAQFVVYKDHVNSSLMS